MSNYEQKNSNILNRFESSVSSTSCKSYVVTLKDGSSMISVDMKKRSLDQMLCDEKKMWGDRFESLKSVEC